MPEGVLGGGDAGAQGGSNGSGAGGAAGASGSAGGGAGGNPPGGAGSGGSGGEKSWRDSLPEDIRTNAAISSFKDVESLAKSHISAQALIGKKGVFVPGEKATDEEWSNFYKSIGVPEADKYDLPAPKDFKGNLDGFKEQALKNGLLPKQAANLLDWYAKNEADAMVAKSTADKAEVIKKLDGLKSEWGDAYAKNIGAGEFFLREKGGADAVKALVDSGLNNNPVIIKLLAEAGKLMGEDKLREGGVGQGGQSPAEISAALEETRALLTSMQKDDPRRVATMSKFESLAKQLTGGR